MNEIELSAGTIRYRDTGSGPAIVFVHGLLVDGTLWRKVVAQLEGRFRCVVERTLAWFNQFRRLRIRYDKRADIHEAFLSLGCALICWQSLRKTWRTA